MSGSGEAEADRLRAEAVRQQREIAEEMRRSRQDGPWRADGH